MSSTTPKKRKHTSEAQSKSSEKKAKSVHFNDKPISITISSADPEAAGVVLARTPGVEPPTNLEFTSYEKREKKRRKLLLHSTTHPRLDFQASSVPRRGPHGKDKHYLGIFDPETNSVELIPAEAVVMKSTLKDQTAWKSATNETNGEEPAEKTFAEKRTALGEEFGTKKAKKALRSVAANAVGGGTRGKSGEKMPVTAITEAIVQAARDTEEVEDIDGGDLKELVETAHPRPTPNLDAEVPADIYKLDELIPWTELQVVDVQGWKSAVLEGENVSTESRFVSHRIVKVAEQKDKVKIRALKYLLGMILWINALVPKGRDGSRKLPKREEMETAMPGIDHATRDNIRRRFMPKDRSLLSPWDINRVLLHACAMAIVLDDCITEVHDLQEDLKLTSKEIRNLYKELGCSVGAFKDDKQQQVAKLRLPFSLPEVRQRSMARR